MTFHRDPAPERRPTSIWTASTASTRSAISACAIRSIGTTPQIFGVSLALGAIAGFAQAQSSVGLDATGLDIYRQGVAANVSQSSARILDRFLNLLPT